MNHQKYLTVAKSCYWIMGKTGYDNEFIVDLYPFQDMTELLLKLNRLSLLHELKLISLERINDDFLLFGRLTKNGIKTKELIQCRTNT